MKRLVLVVEDSEATLTAVGSYLRAEGFEVEGAISVRAAEASFRRRKPDVVVSDYRLEDGTALDLMPRLKMLDSGVPFIILTAYATVDLAVRAMKEGAHHLLTKPVELPVLKVVLDRSVQTRLAGQKQLAQKIARERTPIDPFLGESRAIRSLESVVSKVLDADTTLLILGETGTGKGVLARWIHENSPRVEAAFVNLNCAGLSREFLESELFGYRQGAFTGALHDKSGLLEIAHRGTVFLDEIGDLEISVQPKVLKVLEEKTFRRMGGVDDRSVDIRLIAATHQDLSGGVQAGRFRSDLFYRINTVPITVPPLRERTEDIVPLARAIAHRLAIDWGVEPITLTSSASRALLSYDWPGNVRELANVIERAMLLNRSSPVEAHHLSFEGIGPSQASASSDDLDLSLAEVEARHIERVLDAEQGNVERTARRLGISRSTLYQRLKTLGIRKGSYSR